MHYRTIIISDLHLGTKNTQYTQLIDFLQNNTSENLIINGDIIDGMHLSFFGKRPIHHTNIINYLVHLANDKKTKITYIIGNHDRFWKKIIQKSTLNNVDFNNEIIYQSGNKKYLIFHGHQLDKKGGIFDILEKVGFMMGTFIYWINRIYNQRRKKRKLPYYSIIKKIKQLAKQWMVGSNEKLDEKIKQLCEEKKVDGLICGHLHKPEDRHIGNYHYLNCGDRIEECSAVVENEKNERTLIHYK